jgi:hypothetical protein
VADARDTGGDLSHLDGARLFKLVMFTATHTPVTR